MTRVERGNVAVRGRHERTEPGANDDFGPCGPAREDRGETGRPWMATVR